MKKKICFYINCLLKGGAERVMIQLAQHFQNEGYDVLLITSFMAPDEYTVPSNVRRCSLEIEQDMGSRVKRNFRLIKKLREICKDEKPDMLISFMQEPNFRAILATIGLSTKTIVSVRNDPNKEYAGLIGYIVGNFILPFADGCVFQTEQAQKWFPKRLQNKSRIIFNEVAEVFFKMQRKESNNVVAIGRLTKQKNHKMIMNAFANITDRYPEKKLLIYGTGELEQELLTTIDNLNMKSRICLLGTTDNVADVLANAEVFVLSSNYEGMPNALMEAMAVGIPCISTDCPCGGPKMLIRHNKDGVLISVNDDKALEREMCRIFEERGFAEFLGNNAKRRAEMFKPEKVFDEWKSYVEDSLLD